MYLIIFVLGLIFGSFANVLIYRLPKNLDFVFSKSFCPKCKKNIIWYDNIPLLSFLFLRGKCRKCKNKISFQYPFIEAIGGLGFVVLYYFFNSNPLFLIFNFLFFVLLLSAFVIDMKYQLIPDFLSNSLFVLALVYLFIISDSLIYQKMLSGLIASLYLFVLHLVTKGKGMGLGDVKLVLFGGLVLGMLGTLQWMMLSFVYGAIIGILFILTKNKSLKSKIAFGPFIILAFYTILLL